jgi:hypothetical protein
MCALTLAAIVQAQESDLDAVVKRLGAYTSGYAERFATVIAEEQYNQRTESTRSSPGGPSSSRSGDRTIRSDYALTRVNGEWIAYRDAYEVDGVKVRDRNDRLGRLLSNASSPEDLSAILNDNARFNLENARISRNINLPTLVVQLLAPRTLDRAATSWSRTDTCRTSTFSCRSGCWSDTWTAAPRSAATRAT